MLAHGQVKKNTVRKELANVNRRR